MSHVTAPPAPSTLARLSATFTSEMSSRSTMGNSNSGGILQKADSGLSARAYRMPSADLWITFGRVIGTRLQASTQVQR